MKTVWVICEGPTEEQFIKTVIAPDIPNIAIKPLLLFKGGDVRFERVENQAKLLLTNGHDLVTTFIDLYGLGTGFPEQAAAHAVADVYDRLARLENACDVKITTQARCQVGRFFCYIQPYEFEALLFASPGKIVELEQSWHTTGTKLHRILADFDGNPELINEHVTTAPSKRLMAALPGYQKTTHGPRAAKKIGLNKIETTCKHFRGWLNKLRTISSP